MEHGSTQAGEYEPKYGQGGYGSGYTTPGNRGVNVSHRRIDRISKATFHVLDWTCVRCVTSDTPAPPARVAFQLSQEKNNSMPQS